MRINAANVQLDAIDRAILEVLQQEGRIANQDLAQRVHLSPSACLRRVKALEDAGVIAQYVALLNAKAVGKHGISYTILNLESMSTPLLDSSSWMCSRQSSRNTVIAWRSSSGSNQL